jgi:tRNA dimethylallyltransferase
MPLPLIFLMGPTAVGKTTLAVKLVERLPVEIISVDSAMVYRGMDIGTGKPRSETQAKAAHKLIDICEPHQTYSAAQFARDAQREIDVIRGRRRIPLLVGGTGLYFRALWPGLSSLPAANHRVRARLAAEAAIVGWPGLHARLATIDAPASIRIHPHDGQRIQRALEVYEVTGRSLTQWLAEQRQPAWRGPIVKVVLDPVDRRLLHARIGERFQEMLAEGLVEEVIRLRGQKQVDRALPAMRAVGYRQVCDYLADAIDYQAMVSSAIAATRQLAKRQLTWLRCESSAQRFDAYDRHVVEQVRDHVWRALRTTRGQGEGMGAFLSSS